MIKTMRDADAILHSSGLRQMGKIVGIKPPSLKGILEKIGDVHVKIPAFVSALRDICRECTGYGFVVYDGANDEPAAQGGDGHAVREVFIPFTPATRLNVHSMSKTVTAAAMTHALHLSDKVKLSDPIGPYLRPAWNIPKKSFVRDITFEQLLVHNSGLKDQTLGGVFDERSLLGIRVALERAAEDSEPPDERTYQNVNYSLCRILLPHIDIDSPLTKAEMDAMDEETFNRKTIDNFIRYIKENFFDPLDVPHEIRPRPNPVGGGPFTRYYEFERLFSPLPLPDLLPLRSIADATDTTLEELVGASAWFMSAADYGKFIVGLRHKTIFGRDGEKWSPWETMTDFDRRVQPSKSKAKVYRLGMTEEDVGLAKGVVALAKSGGGSETYGPTTAWIAFSNLTAVLLINCNGGKITSHLEPGEGIPDLSAVTALSGAIRAALKGI